MSNSYQKKALVSETITMDVDKRFYNWTATVSYYSNVDETPAVPSGGTIAVTGLIPGATGYSDFNLSPLDCTNISDYCTAGVPLSGVKITPTGVTGATHYKVTITGTEG